MFSPPRGTLACRWEQLIMCIIKVLGQPRAFVMDHAYWGPEFTSRRTGLARDLESSELGKPWAPRCESLQTPTC